MPAEHRLLTWTAEEQTSKQRHTPKSEASMRTPPGRLRGIRRSIIHLLFTEKLWLQVLADPTQPGSFRLSGADGSANRTAVPTSGTGH